MRRGSRFVIGQRAHVERPRSAAAFAERLAAADAAREPVSIQGGNTLAGMGKPVDSAVVLSTAALNAVVADEAADLTVAVESGLTVETLSKVLAAHGTFVPLDAPLASRATVGGTLAAGWLGPRRHRYGRSRDFLIGSVAALPDGTLARAGGMVVKNVAGYDMSRLYVGSFGTLCVLTQANFKTIPAAAAARLCIAPLPEYTRARAIALCSELPIVPSAAWWISGFRKEIDGADGADGRLLIVLEDSESVVARATRDVRSALGRAGIAETSIVDSGVQQAFQRTLDAYLAPVGERSITYRIPAEPNDSEPRCGALLQICNRFELRVDVLVDAMNGDIVLRVSDLDARALGTKIEMFDDALHDAEPYAVVIAGKHSSRALLSVWGTPPDGIERMRSLKARFDPNGILNPGRFVGGI